MQYEIRETTASTDPADRGRLLGIKNNISDATKLASNYNARGVNCFVAVIGVK